MLSSKPVRSGDLVGTMYDMPEVGDGLPMHTHTESDAHVTIVARGEVEIRVGEDWTRRLAEGAFVDLPPDKPHSIIAVVKHTRIFNILKRCRSTTA